MKRDENEVYAEWRAHGQDDRDLETELIRCLYSHATAVIFKKLGERHPGLANACVFAAVAQAKAGRFRGEAKFSSWFQEIVNKRCMTYLRGHISRKVERPLEERDFPVEQNYDAKIQLEGIRASLTPVEKVLLDCKMEQLSDHETAKQLGIRNPDSHSAQIAVSSRWKRLKGKIRAAYGERGSDSSQEEA